MDPEHLEEKKFFTILALTAATTSMSDNTCYNDETLPNFDRNTLENILMCKPSTDKDDMRKLDTLSKKLIAEVEYRARACMVYIETE